MPFPQLWEEQLWVEQERLSALSQFLCGQVDIVNFLLQDLLLL
jgi:hypothetical protein